MRVSRGDIQRGRAGSAGDLLRGPAFLAELGRHLRHPLTVEEARAILRRRLERREADFLALMRRCVFGSRNSPYRPLLRRAGCEYGDLAALVSRVGLEEALIHLLREGIYLTVAETKGHHPATRGTVHVAAELPRLRTPAWRVEEPAAPDGAARRMGLYRAMLTDVAVGATLFIDARRGAAWRHARWGLVEVLPSTLWNLRLTGRGYGPDRWFSQIDPRTWPIRARVLARLICWIGARAGVPLPVPEHASREDPRPIIEWLTDTRRAGRTPHLQAATGGLVALAQEAVRRGFDLEGVQLLPSAEPFTRARAATLRATGAEAVPSYGAKEAGQIGWGCLAPVATDDMHFTDDRFAVIQSGSHGIHAGLPPAALLFSSLRAAWPLVLLNVSLGDQAALDRRVCGCPLGTAGWQTHVHDVRSFDKLKVGFLRDPVALIRLLEETLPRRVGGVPSDFQLVEDEEHLVAGRPRIRLLVHPRVGPVEAREVADVFLDMGRASGSTVDAFWLDPGRFSVERRPPYQSGGGKTYHVHQLSAGDEQPEAGNGR